MYKNSIDNIFREEDVGDAKTTSAYSGIIIINCDANFNPLYSRKWKNSSRRRNFPEMQVAGGIIFPYVMYTVNTCNYRSLIALCILRITHLIVCNFLSGKIAR